jgi:hypothetical protein
MSRDQLKISQYFYYVFHKSQNDFLLFRFRLLQDRVAGDHLITSQRIFERSLENIEHHVKRILEITLVFRLALEHILYEGLDLRAVALAEDCCNIQQLGYVKYLMLVYQSFIEINRKILSLRAHILRQSIENLKHNFQTFIYLFFQCVLDLVARLRNLAVIQRLVEIDIDLFKIIVFSHLL